MSSRKSAPTPDGRAFFHGQEQSKVPKLIKDMKNIIKLIISIVICQLAGVIGSIYTTPAIKTWYAFLNKPSFNPPNFVFAPVWTILFLLMGVALYLAWLKKQKEALIIFAFQLILNVLWSIIFFGLKMPSVALVEILMLWVAILYTLVNFYRVSKLAGFLLLPYLLWVAFAAVLNLSIWLLN